MTRYAILLRGVTPSGRNRVPMADLRAALAEAGLAEVQTYIQSGNVVARSGLERAALQSLVHDVIAREIGADIAVIARTHQEIAQVMAGNPFPLDCAARSYFTLLAAAPTPALVEELGRLQCAPDAVALVGSTVYTLYATKLSDSRCNNNFFERKLKVAATTRNFNTMSRLAAMTA